LGLDFLSPESLGEAVRLAEEVRRLPNEHEAKLQVLEVSKDDSYNCQVLFLLFTTCL
jgi:lysine-specific demethylase 3